MQARYLIGGAVGVVVGLLIMVIAGSGALSARSAAPNASNTLVSCEPSQRVIVRHAVVNGELQVATECVGAASGAGLVPAVYETTGVAPVTMGAPRTIARAQTPTSARTTSVRRASTSAQTAAKKRTWQQTALVVGGAAGAGAGVGALIDGKKGALIGAAVGGGAGAIYEAIKRK